MTTPTDRPNIYNKIYSAQEKIDWNKIEKMAAIMGAHYFSSKGKIASKEELENCLAGNTYMAEKTFYENCNRGNGRAPVRVSSGHWTVAVYWWGNEPTVEISFGERYSS